MGVLHLITGNEEYAIKNKVREVTTKICGDPPDENPDLEIIQGDSDTMKPEEIINALMVTLQTPPFLSTQRIVWLRHFAWFELAKSSAKGKKGKTEFDQLTDFIKAGIPEDVILIIDGPELDRRCAFYKACGAAGEIDFFEKPNPTSKDYAQMQGLKIREICAQAGKHLSPDAEGFLMETLGGDLGRMQNELEKLFCHAGESDTITIEDCQAVSCKTPEVLSWAFSDALCDRNLKKAIETVNILVEQMRAERGSSGLELGLLHSAIGRFQQLVELKAVAEELRISPRAGYQQFKAAFDGAPDDMRESRGRNSVLAFHPYRAFILFTSASKFSDRQLTAAISSLLETNRALVSGGGNPRIALEALINNICLPQVA